MAYDDVSGAGKDSAKESNDQQSAASLQADAQSEQSNRLSQEQRDASRSEMTALTGSDFQIVDQANNGKPC